MKNYVKHTPILNFTHPGIQSLIALKGWHNLNRRDAVEAAYNFVRDDIAFGYNRDDNIPASDVLKDGYGQCNTKSTLFMAILRGLGIECRFHGFTIYNALQKGAIPSYLMPFAPRRILHSWVEVLIDGQWLNMEGFIIDTPFLKQIQNAHPNQRTFQGYGIATRCLQSPQNNFNGEHTYIQAEGIADDFGIFDSPDEFYAQFGSNLTGLRKKFYQSILRKIINRHVNLVREKGLLRFPEYIMAMFHTSIPKLPEDVRIQRSSMRSIRGDFHEE